jgi:hypothetical protein
MVKKLEVKKQIQLSKIDNIFKKYCTIQCISYDIYLYDVNSDFILKI